MGKAIFCREDLVYFSKTHTHTHTHTHTTTTNLSTLNPGRCLLPWYGDISCCFLLHIIALLNKLSRVIKKNCWGSCWAWVAWAWTGLLANLHQCPLQAARLAFLVLLPSSFLLLILLNQIQVAFAHWALWAGAPSQEATCAEWSCVYLPLGVAAVARGFVAWGGQWGVQPFVITWFLTHLPHLLDGRSAAFPHPPRPGLYKRDMCEAGHTP